MINQIYRQILNQREIQHSILRDSVYIHLFYRPQIVCMFQTFQSKCSTWNINIFLNIFKLEIELKILSVILNKYYQLIFKIYLKFNHFLLSLCATLLIQDTIFSYLDFQLNLLTILFSFLLLCTSRSHSAPREVPLEYRSGLYFPVLNWTIISCVGHLLLHNRSS